jgi:hypothetical protein
MRPETHIYTSSMGALGKESNAAFGVFFERMDLSTARRCGPNTLKWKSTGCLSASLL